MKKKNLNLGKLTLTKTNVASLADQNRVMGGSNGPGCNTGIECTESCPQNTCTSVPPPPPTNGCATVPDCFTQAFSCGPACFPTQQNCVTQQTCGGNFLCDNELPGGLF